MRHDEILVKICCQPQNDDVGKSEPHRAVKLGLAVSDLEEVIFPEQESAEYSFEESAGRNVEVFPIVPELRASYSGKKQQQRLEMIPGLGACSPLFSGAYSGGGWMCPLTCITTAILCHTQFSGRTVLSTSEVRPRSAC